MNYYCYYIIIITGLIKISACHSHRLTDNTFYNKNIKTQENIYDAFIIEPFLHNLENVCF